MSDFPSPAMVLVVDDDPFTAKLTSFILESTGFKTVIAEGGVDALEKLEEEPSIAVIVSDMNMPFLSGVDLFNELRRQGSLHPFVLLTGDEAAPLASAYPDIDAVVCKNEQLGEMLPELISSLLSHPR